MKNVVLIFLLVSLSTLTRYNHGLWLFEHLHVPKSFVSNGKHVRWHCAQRFALISLDGFCIIQIFDIIIRIDSYGYNKNWIRKKIRSFTFGECAVGLYFNWRSAVGPHLNLGTKKVGKSPTPNIFASKIVYWTKKVVNVLLPILQVKMFTERKKKSW